MSEPHRRPAFADLAGLPPTDRHVPAPAPARPGAVARRAAMAVGLVPPAVLLALLAVVAGLIEPATGMALFMAGMAWLVFELHRYLQRLDAELDAVVQPGPWA